MNNPVSIASRFEDLRALVRNPRACVRSTLESIEAIHNGTITHVDGSNPFVHSLEATCVNTSLFLLESESILRQQYASLAQTFEELYPHLSDTDLVGAFALPSQATFKLALSMTELDAAMVRDPVTGISKVTLPRNTYFSVGDTSFSLSYPLHISRFPHGGLQVTYDTAVASPLKTLSNNVVPFIESKDTDQNRYLIFEVQADQFQISSAFNTIDGASGFTTTVAFQDQFYYCRVYYRQSGEWKELRTAYAEDVFDPTVPTANIKVLDGKVKCTIPFLYVNNAMVSGRIRIDVYTTLGNSEMYLSGFSPGDFSATWRYLNEADGTQAVAAMSKITNLLIWSDSITSGGRNALSFEQLRERVMQYTIGPRQVPVTVAQNADALADAGYKIVKNIDTITGRSQLATRGLPPPKNSLTSTAASASMVELVASIEQAQAGYGVKSHTSGVTLTNACLFKTFGDVAQVVSEQDYLKLSTLSNEELARVLNEGAYSFSPFYYVLDNSAETFSARAYQLDSPKVLTRNFVQYNSSTQVLVSIGSMYELIKTNSGYRLSVIVQSDDAYKDLPDSEVFCQLSLADATGSSKGFLMGTLVEREDDSQERTFHFDLTTDYDLSTDHRILFDSLVSSSGVRNIRSALNQTFRLVFGTTAQMPPTYQSTAMDSLLGQFQLPDGAVPISVEELSVRFGTWLDALWVPHRSAANGVPYLTHTQDVLRYHDQDVYAKDPITGAIYDVVNGELVYNILHHKDDPYLDSAGNQEYLFRKGDPILDPTTNRPTPIPGYSTQLRRIFSVYALDAIYAFANDLESRNYLAQVKLALSQWIEKDLSTVNTTGLEQTKTYFHPKVSRGIVSVRIDDDLLMSVDAEQTLRVTLYVTPDVYSNSELLATLHSSSVVGCEKYLTTNTTISTDGIQNYLKSVLGSDVVSLRIENLLGRSDPVVATLTNGSNQFSLAKNLRVQANGQMVVAENITISFVIHKTETIVR